MDQYFVVFAAMSYFLYPQEENHHQRNGNTLKYTDGRMDGQAQRANRSEITREEEGTVSVTLKWKILYTLVL